ncbi:hypothetical protein FKM82_015487 [Ascaphus truei]
MLSTYIQGFLSKQDSNLSSHCLITKETCAQKQLCFYGGLHRSLFLLFLRVRQSYCKLLEWTAKTQLAPFTENNSKLFSLSTGKSNLSAAPFLNLCFVCSPNIFLQCPAELATALRELCSKSL